VDANGNRNLPREATDLTTERFDRAAFDPIDGYSLAMYADVCRALVRLPAGSTRQLETALADQGLTLDLWTRIRQGWSARIASDPFVRGAFRGLYLGDAPPSTAKAKGVQR
jgi:hypothetical protein